MPPVSGIQLMLLSVPGLFPFDTLGGDVASSGSSLHNFEVFDFSDLVGDLRGCASSPRLEGDKNFVVRHVFN